MKDKVKALYREHQEFILLLVLFVVFRWLAVVAYRPGGLVLDFSDFYFYRVFAQLTRAGYYPYVNLWTAYPPIFPYLMIGLYQLSALLPPGLSRTSGSPCCSAARCSSSRPATWC